MSSNFYSSSMVSLICSLMLKNWARLQKAFPVGMEVLLNSLKNCYNFIIFTSISGSLACLASRVFSFFYHCVAWGVVCGATFHVCSMVAYHSLEALPVGTKVLLNSLNICYKCYILYFPQWLIGSSRISSIQFFLALWCLEFCLWCHLPRLFFGTLVEIKLFIYHDQLK